MATRMILVQYFMLFLHGINLIYAYNVSRSIGASTSNGFYTSKDSFRNTEQSKKCNHFNAKCIQSRISDNGSIRCSVCDCGKRKTFLSYSHGCMNNTDLYKAIGVEKCLEFKSEAGKIPTITDETFQSDWCPEIQLPPGQEANYKYCHIQYVFANTLDDGGLEKVSLNFKLENSKHNIAGSCLKCSNCNLNLFDGRIIYIHLFCKGKVTNGACLVLKKDGTFRKWILNCSAVERDDVMTTVMKSYSKSPTKIPPPATATTTKTTITLSSNKPTTTITSPSNKPTTTTTRTVTSPTNKSTTTSETSPPSKSTVQSTSPSTKESPTTTIITTQITTTTVRVIETTNSEHYMGVTKQVKRKKSSKESFRIIISVVVVVTVALVVFGAAIFIYRKKNLRRKIRNMKFSFDSFAQELRNPSLSSPTSEACAMKTISGSSEQLFNIAEDESPPKYETMMKPRHHSTSENEYCKPSDLKLMKDSDEKRHTNIYYQKSSDMMENCYYGGSISSYEENDFASCGDKGNMRNINHDVHNQQKTRQSKTMENQFYESCNDISQCLGKGCTFYELANGGSHIEKEVHNPGYDHMINMNKVQNEKDVDKLDEENPYQGIVEIQGSINEDQNNIIGDTSEDTTQDHNNVTEDQSLDDDYVYAFTANGSIQEHDRLENTSDVVSRHPESMSEYAEPMISSLPSVYTPINKDTLVKNRIEYNNAK